MCVCVCVCGGGGGVEEEELRVGVRRLRSPIRNIIAQTIQLVMSGGCAAGVADISVDDVRSKRRALGAAPPAAYVMIAT